MEPYTSNLRGRRLAWAAVFALALLALAAVSLSDGAEACRKATRSPRTASYTKWLTNTQKK